MQDKRDSCKDYLKQIASRGRTMTDASICGLGQTAASTVLSAIKLWPGIIQ